MLHNLTGSAVASVLLYALYWVGNSGVLAWSGASV